MELMRTPSPRSLVLVAALAVAPVLVQAAPAQAAGSMTLWVDDNYQNQSETRASYDSTFDNDPCGINDCGLYDIGGAFSDDASSYKNSSGDWWKLYKDNNYTGYAVCVRPYGFDADLGDSTQVEDEINSIKRFGTSRPGGCDAVVG